MTRERMCQYGNCHETSITVTVNTGDERPAFCSLEHAGRWLLREAWMIGRRSAATAAEIVADVQSDLRSP